MRIQKQDRPDGVRQVTLSGRLDLEGVHAVDADLHAAIAGPGRPSIVDMAEVTFIGSCGVGLLVGCATSLRRRGARLVLYHVRPPVLEVLRSACVTQLLPVADDESVATAVARAGC